MPELTQEQKAAAKLFTALRTIYPTLKPSNIVVRQEVPREETIQTLRSRLGVNLSNPPNQITIIEFTNDAPPALKGDMHIIGDAISRVGRATVDMGNPSMHVYENINSLIAINPVILDAAIKARLKNEARGQQATYLD